MPVIILTTKQEIDHEHRDSRTRYYHEAVAEEQEAEHVVDLAEPDGRHDEVELDEDGSKG